jgi:hypothetical protein
MPIKYVDLDGLEPANNPEDPANQDGRDPTATINSIYDESGGQSTYEQNFSIYMNGTYDANATVSGVENKPGYTSDSQDASKYNLWVNNKGVFFANDYPNWDSRDLTNFLMGCFVTGTGPENIVFPTNGSVSNLFKDAFVVRDAIAAWYATNTGRNNLVGITTEMDGNKGNLWSVIENGFINPESMIGSATVKISPVNDKQIMVTVINVTSLTSGDLRKHLPWNDYSTSVVRDPSKASSRGANAYGNVSQTYSFTLPINSTLLKK